MLDRAAEKGSAYSSQPIIIEQATKQFIKKIVDEIKTGQISFLNRYALIKTTGKNYVREWQIDLILKAIWKYLTTEKGEYWLKQQLRHLLIQLRDHPPAKGYAAGNILNLLCHNDSIEVVEHYDFSRLFISQAYLQGIKLHHINFSNAEFDRCTFTETFGSTLCVAFSPDGKFLASGDVHSKGHLWKKETRQYIKTLTGHTGWVWSLAFSPNSELLASTDTDQTIKLWKRNPDGNSYSAYKALKGGCPVWSVAFDVNNEIIATGNDQGTIALWDIENAKCVGTLRGHKLAVWCVHFSPNRRHLASSSSDKTIRIWDYHRGECVAILTGHTEFIRSVAFSSNGRWLVSGSDDKTVKVWAVETGECFRTFSLHDNIVRSVTFHPNNHEVISGSDDGKIRGWNIDSGEPIWTLDQKSIVSSIDIDPKTQEILTGGENQSVRLWTKDYCLHTWQGYTTLARNASFSPDGQLLASSHDDRIIRLWDVETGKCVKTLTGHHHIIWQVIFNSDDKLLVSASSDKTVKIWDLKTDKCLKTLESGCNNWIFVIAFSPDNKYIAAAGTDYTVKIWKVETWQLVKTLEGHTSLITGIAFHSVKILVSVSIDRTVRVWDIDTENCIKVLPLESSNYMKNLYWTPKIDFNDDRILTGSHTKKLWDSSKNRYKYIKELPERRVALVPNHDSIISVDDDMKIKIWNVHTDQCFTLQEKSVSAVGNMWYIQFSPNGHKVAIIHDEGQIKIWSINGLTQKAECLRTLNIAKPYEGINITDVKGLSDAQKMSLKELGAIVVGIN